MLSFIRKCINTIISAHLLFSPFNELHAKSKMQLHCNYLQSLGRVIERSPVCVNVHVNVCVCVCCHDRVQF